MLNAPPSVELSDSGGLCNASRERALDHSPNAVAFSMIILGFLLLVRIIRFDVKGNLQK